MFIKDPIYKGNVIIKKPKEFEDQKAMWLPIEKTLLSDKTCPSVEMLKWEKYHC